MVMRKIIVLLFRIGFWKKNWKEKLFFIVKGLIFLPWLYHDLQLTTVDMASSHLHEAGGDIYPLF
jgi:hypothetical protein